MGINEVRFDFLTQEGYGTGVLQKDPSPMQTLGQAVEMAKKYSMAESGKFVNGILGSYLRDRAA